MFSKETEDAWEKRLIKNYDDLLECAMYYLGQDRVTDSEIEDAIYDALGQIHENRSLEIYNGKGFPFISVVLYDVELKLARELLKGCLYDDIVKQVTLVETVRVGSFKFKRIKKNNKFIAVESIE